MTLWEADWLIFKCEVIAEEYVATGDEILIEVLSDIILELFNHAPEA